MYWCIVELTCQRHTNNIVCVENLTVSLTEYTNYTITPIYWSIGLLVYWSIRPQDHVFVRSWLDDEAKLFIEFVSIVGIERPTHTL